MYKSAIIGVSGPRANADAYAHIKRSELIALSTRNEGTGLLYTEIF